MPTSMADFWNTVPYPVSLPVTTGDYIFLHSPTGSNNNDGVDKLRPVATLDRAFDRVRASQGDVIIAMPGHVENIANAAGAVCNIAGTTVWTPPHIRGTQRPRYNFTAVAADIDINAANITFVNQLFTGGIDGVTAAIDVNAAGFSLIDCEWRDVTGNVANFLSTNGAADNMLIDGFVHRGDLVAATGANATVSSIAMAANDHPVIRNSTFIGVFDVAAIRCITTAVVLMECYNCRFINLDNRAVATAGTAIEDVVTGSTGLIGPNIMIYVETDGANITEAITGATFRLVDPIYVVNAAAQKGLLINWTASTD